MHQQKQMYDKRAAYEIRKEYPKRTTYDKLNSLRGLIALTMAMYHSQFFIVPRGSELMHNAYLCVDMLFILSGFVLSAAYSERIRNGLEFREMMIMRLGRLYPLHAAMMFVWLGYVFAKQFLYLHGFGEKSPFINNDLPSFFGSLLLLNSMGIFDHVNWNVPSWSMGALMLCYITFFIFCKFVTRSIYAKALLLAVMGYGFIGIVLRKTNFDITYDYGFVRCAAGFYAGVFCYGLKQHLHFPALSTREFAWLEWLALIVFLCVLENAERSAWILYGSLPLLMAIILLFSGKTSGVIGKVLETKPLQWLGKLAFSIYLTHYIIVLTAANFFQYVLHWPMQPVRESYGITVMGFIGPWTLAINALLVSCILGASTLTYRYIEMPCRDWSRALAKKNNKLSVEVLSANR